MKQKFLFVALMAASSHSLLSHYHHRGYWGGGPSFGLYIGGPSYGYGPGFYSGYYDPYYTNPFNAVANIAGAAITADAIRSSNELSRKHSQDKDPNKSRRSELAGRIFDAQEDLDSLKRSNANASDIDKKQEEIKTLRTRLNELR